MCVFYHESGGQGDVPTIKAKNQWILYFLKQ
jgi:hypothetical protein